MKHIFKYIPGFRTGKRAKKIVASVYYVFCFTGFFVDFGAALVALMLPLVIFYLIDIFRNLKMKTGVKPVPFILSVVIFFIGVVLVGPPKKEDTAENINQEIVQEGITKQDVIEDVAGDAIEDVVLPQQEIETKEDVSTTERKVDKEEVEENKELTPPVAKITDANIVDIDDANESQEMPVSKHQDEPTDNPQNDIVEGFAKAIVTKHVDGDTVHVTLEDGEILKIRMIGVNTPETVHPSKPVEFYGKEASDFTKKEIFNKTVYLEKDVSDVDMYGRALRYIWIDIPTEFSKEEIKEKMFNAILVAHGYANVATYPPDVKYKDYFLEFEREAREGNLGLWSDSLAESEASGTSATTPSSGVEDNGKFKEYDIPIESTYIGNSSSMKFHRPDCSSARKIAPENRVELTSREEAIDKGYSPCGICKP